MRIDEEGETADMERAGELEVAKAASSTSETAEVESLSMT